MPTVRQLLPHVPDDDLTKTQSWVSLRQKRIILSAVGDDGIFTFITRIAFERTAKFIQDNDIQSYDPSKFNLLIDFIRNGTDPRVDRSSSICNEPRATSGVQCKTPSTASVPSSDGKSSQRRGRKQSKQTEKGKGN